MLDKTTTNLGIALHYGHGRRSLVDVVPDGFWPGMWRLLWPDGQLSDMTNLARAKDAAIAICERGPPARNRRSFDWRQELSRTPSGAPPPFAKPEIPHLVTCDEHHADLASLRRMSGAEAAGRQELRGAA